MKILSMTIASLVLLAATTAVATNAASLYRSSDAPIEITNGPAAEYIGCSRAVIAWATSTRAVMKIRFGTSREHLDNVATIQEKAHGRHHYATLDQLKPETDYFFEVLGEDGNPIGEMGTFRTLKAGATPVIEKILP